MTAYLTDLNARRQALAEKEPTLRARDIAARLGISEIELVALGSEGTTVARLKPDWTGIIAEVSTLGRVMALTRNEDCVHERKGVYGTLEGGGHVGLIVGDDIDLRIFFNHWRFGFAVTQGERRSLQFFDRAGIAIHKIYLTESSDVAAFDGLVARWSVAATPLEIKPSHRPRASLPDAEVDVAGFRAAWDAMTDTHDFHGLISTFKVDRAQAFRLAGELRARAVPTSSLRNLMTTAVARKTSIMVFVGNPGMIQIHTGAIENLKTMGPWFNVLDESFNLHLREDMIASAWVVWKPADEGVVTSLELFNPGGELIGNLFGKRKPGQPEDEAWRALVADLFEKEAA